MRHRHMHALLAGLFLVPLAGAGRLGARRKPARGKMLLQVRAANATRASSLLQQLEVSSQSAELALGREPTTCEACVAASRSWQAGGCNPSADCVIADVGCFTDSAGCVKWAQHEAARRACEGSGCILGEGYWGPPDLVVGPNGTCP
mmetsp:Transcript_48305/g.137973  ORF Transcript_48305/g.137973 Transcript_48305/m.137973 type:complete len:147 (-) Transcript_48305:38-478(-)